MSEQSWGEALGSLRRKLGPEMSDTLGIPEPQVEVEVAGWIVALLAVGLALVLAAAVLMWVAL